MDSELKQSLIAIIKSTEGSDILNSIASAFRGIQHDNVSREQIRRFNLLSDLFYGEMYEIVLVMKRVIDKMGFELSPEDQEAIDNFITMDVGLHNISNYSRNKIEGMYGLIGGDPPADVDTIDILKGFHNQVTQVHKCFLTKVYGFYGKISGGSYRYFSSISGQPNGLCRFYIGDKRNITINLKYVLKGDPPTKTCPVLAISSNEYSFGTPSDFDKFSIGFDLNSFFIESGRFTKREFTNGTTTLIPEVAYFANAENYVANSEHTITIDDDVLSNNNIKWLYVGIDDTSPVIGCYVAGAMLVTLTSTYDNYCVKD